MLLTGASGLGKSWLVRALGHKAGRENMFVPYTRAPRLFADLAIAYGVSVAFATPSANGRYLREADDWDRGGAIIANSAVIRRTKATGWQSV